MGCLACLRKPLGVPARGGVHLARVLGRPCAQLRACSCIPLSHVHVWQGPQGACNCLWSCPGARGGCTLACELWLMGPAGHAVAPWCPTWGQAQRRGPVRIRMGSHVRGHAKGDSQGTALERSVDEGEQRRCLLQSLA